MLVLMLSRCFQKILEAPESYQQIDCPFIETVFPKFRPSEFAKHFPVSNIKRQCSFLHPNTVGLVDSIDYLTKAHYYMYE